MSEETSRDQPSSPEDAQSNADGVCSSEDPTPESNPPHSEEQLDCMVCAQCRHPIAFSSDIIAERIDILQTDVFSYDLDLFDSEITAYSATNPNANRFDVIRIKFDSNSSICPRVSIDNQYVADHSWFPPHAWCFAVCQNCRSHLGWCFQAPPRSPSDETPSEDHSSPSDVKRQRIAGGGGGGASVDNETVGVPNEELRDNVETAVTTARYDVDDTDPTADKDTPQTEGTQRDSTSTKQSTESQKFLGLIVTKLRPSKISVPDFQQRERHARRGEGQQRLTWRERMMRLREAVLRHLAEDDDDQADNSNNVVNANAEDSDNDEVDNNNNRPGNLEIARAWSRIRHLAADIVVVDEREYDASDEEGVDDEVEPGPPDVQ